MPSRRLTRGECFMNVGYPNSHRLSVPSSVKWGYYLPPRAVRYFEWEDRPPVPCSLSGIYQMLNTQSSFSPLLPLSPKLLWNSNEIKGKKEKTHSAKQGSLSGRSTVSSISPIFPDRSLPGPTQEYVSQNVPVVCQDARLHMQRCLGNAVYSSSPFEAYDTQYLSKASWKSCSDKTLCDSNPRLSSGVVEPLLCSTPTEHPQGDAASQPCDCSQSWWANSTFHCPDIYASLGSY